MSTFRPRVIPVLLLRGRGLVKSKRFQEPRYIGDPINAVKIFNELRADELVFLDTQATPEGRLISLDFVADVGSEARIPFAVGGGIRSVEDALRVVDAGAEKVVLGSVAVSDPQIVGEIASVLGRSSVAVCIDVRRNHSRLPEVYSHSGGLRSAYGPVEFAQLMEKSGAGELIVQSIDRDGTGEGYDLPLVASVSAAVTIPVIALGGAGSMQHLQEGHKAAHASGLAAGSLFVYHGPRQGVLLNYPDVSEIRQLFS